MFYIIQDTETQDVIDKFASLQEAEAQLQHLNEATYIVKAVAPHVVSKISVELPYKVSKDLVSITDWQEACIKRYAHDGTEQVWNFESLQDAKDFMQKQKVASIREFSSNGMTYQVKEWFELSEVTWLDTFDCIEIKDN